MSEQFEGWNKPSWDDWYMGLAFYVSQRSPDTSTKHGCVFISQDYEPIVFAYNAFPQDCDDENMPMTRPDKYDVMVHAEENGIDIAAKQGKRLKDSILYVTGPPCMKCFRSLIRCGVLKVIYGPVASNCVTAHDDKMIALMNKSKKTGKDKIELVEYVGEFIPVLQQTISYVRIKTGKDCNKCI